MLGFVPQPNLPGLLSFPSESSLYFILVKENFPIQIFSFCEKTQDFLLGRRGTPIGRRGTPMKICVA
jgi:hypothetical protein